MVNVAVLPKHWAFETEYLIIKRYKRWDKPKPIVYDIGPIYQIAIFFKTTALYIRQTNKQNKKYIYLSCSNLFQVSKYSLRWFP